MLCYRCEHRARSLEAARRGDTYTPRYECGDHKASVGGCYMFQPCRPVVTAPDSDDARPRFAGALLAARERAQRVLDPQADGIALVPVWHDGDGVALTWAKAERKAKKAVDKRRSKRV